jgi:hypothetical protein
VRGSAVHRVLDVGFSDVAPDAHIVAVIISLRLTFQVNC